MATERDRIELLLAGRADLNDAQRAYLRGKTSALDVALLLAAMRTSRARAGVRAARSAPAVAASIASRFGRSERKPTIHWEGNDLVLERISQADARALLASRGEALPSPSVLIGADVTTDVPAITQQMMLAALAARGKPVIP